MTIYEKRTYSVMVGRMPDALRLYTDEGWPALDAGGFGENLVGYFVSDTGPLHQLIHIWRFDDDNDRRDFWKRLFADEAFMKFAPQIRPLIQTQEIQLMVSAPWGPKP
ncbi:MAG: NIPSNAP family protein [Gammaproteobacteria bacterium]